VTLTPDGPTIARPLMRLSALSNRDESGILSKCDLSINRRQRSGGAARWHPFLEASLRRGCTEVRVLSDHELPLLDDSR
jgi:hypothetical protein